MELYFKKINLLAFIFGFELLALSTIISLSYFGFFDISTQGDFPLWVFYLIAPLMLFLALFLGFLLKKRIIHAISLEDKLVAFFPYAIIPLAISMVPCILALIISFFHREISVFYGPLLSAFGYVFFLPSKTKLLNVVVVSEKELEKVDWEYVHQKLSKNRRRY